MKNIIWAALIPAITAFEDFEYRKCVVPKTFDEAQASCEKWGGNLTSIYNEIENKEVAKIQ